MTLQLLDEEEFDRPAEVPDLTAKPDWKLALKRAASKFGTDGCTDLAAALTYRSMQALFPALIAVLSLLNIFGNGKQTATDVVDKIGDIIGKSGDDDSLKGIKSFIGNVTTQGGGGIALAVGILLALNSASGYVGAFSKATNRIYEIPEGRPTIKLKLSLLLVTIVEVLLILVVIFLIVTTGSVARELGNAIGLGGAAVTVWDWVKWPFVVFLVVLIIGILFWAAPNVQKNKKEIFTWGALIGFLVWMLASAALAIYIALSHGASYQKTYGIFANAIIFMLWLWITNLAILFGAEVDAELLRTRQLKSGLPAEELVQLPPKSDAQFPKLDRKIATQYDDAHELRMNAMREATGDSGLYGRAALTAGHAAQLVGDSSTAGRQGKTGLVGPRDASARRPELAITMGENGAEAGAAAMDPQDEGAVEEARLRRRDDYLRRSIRARVVRDRVARQQAEKDRRRKEQLRRAQERHKIADSYITREQRWASVEELRSAYDPAPSAEREEITSQRADRRMSYHQRKAADKAEAIDREKRSVAHRYEPSDSDGDSDKKLREAPPEPSVMRTELEREQRERRDSWFAEHPRRSGN